MKIGFLSVCVMLCALYGTESSAYFAEKSQRVIAPPLTPITIRPQVTNETEVPKLELQDQKKSPEAIVKESLCDGRSFADVVKGVKKTDTLSDKKEAKKEKKSKKRLEKFLQSNSKKEMHDNWRAKRNEADDKFSKRWLSAKDGVNKRSQSSHRGNLYKSR